jgi:hypothetical protein
MMALTELRERFAQCVKDRMGDDVVVSTLFQPVLEVNDKQAAIVINPVSLQSEFLDRQRYSVVPSFAATITKRVTDSKETAGDAVLEIVSKLISVVMGVGFGGVIVKACDVSNPLITDEQLQSNSVVISRVTFTLQGYEERTK